MLGHSMGTLRLYERLHEVHNYYLGGLGYAPLKNVQNFTASWLVLKPHQSEMYITYMANLRTVSIRDS